MTDASHRRSGGYAPTAAFLILGTLLSISISVNAVFYVMFTWNLVPG